MADNNKPKQKLFAKDISDDPYIYLENTTGKEFGLVFFCIAHC